jgi:hypothetical protein
VAVDEERCCDTAIPVSPLVHGFVSLFVSDILSGPAVSSEWWAATFTHPASLSMSTPPKPAPEPASLLTKYVVDQQPPSAAAATASASQVFDVHSRPWQSRPSYVIQTTPADRGGGGGDSLRALEDIRDSLAQLRVQLGRDTRVSQPAGGGTSEDLYRASLYSPPSAQYSPIAGVGVSPSSSTLPRTALQSQPELIQRTSDARMRASFSGETLGSFATPPRSPLGSAPADGVRSGTRSALYEAAYPSSPSPYERYSALAGPASSYGSRLHFAPPTPTKLGGAAGVSASYTSLSSQR